jgi:hypothetical protein
MTEPELEKIWQKKNETTVETTAARPKKVNKGDGKSLPYSSQFGLRLPPQLQICEKAIPALSSNLTLVTRNGNIVGTSKKKYFQTKLW